ncbi:CD0519/CD1768 family membrane protein [Sporanaerobacter sp. PP17-6a]|uniref:CD0519/CD1768 family membrane protein n=1 Tax=Sporanaerobacter sp. PP17-6a TaxID=1891289 RepID=UPI0008A00B4D|nr:nucleoside recognition domain-containing protein [Sporanaerobacter sp. PP17-6a]SCL87620.1 Nucleoside recognition [Sporanaerobacter sp. PP17-6a]
MKSKAENKTIVKAISKESFIWLAIIIIFFVLFTHIMGAANMFKTMMATAHDLIINTSFFIMGVAVLASAFSAVLSEFGVISIINKILSPIIKPLYGLPGVASLGIMSAYLSDNPAIVSLASEKNFQKYFKQYQFSAITNLGVSFGMGLVVSTFMIAQAKNGQSFLGPVIIGNIGAIIGSIISVRAMTNYTKKIYGTEKYLISESDSSYDITNFREIRSGSALQRLLEAMLDGGKAGVSLGLSIIPGVVIICTFVMMLTNGPSLNGIYTGAAYEGIKVMPWIGEKLKFILNPVFGFNNPELIAFPVTSMGSVGAALGLVPKFLSKNIIGENEIAVFTAVGICWSGYLSSQIPMMDALHMRHLAPKALAYQTLGGFSSGIFAHLIYIIYASIF